MLDFYLFVRCFLPDFVLLVVCQWKLCILYYYQKQVVKDAVKMYQSVSQCKKVTVTVEHSSWKKLSQCISTSEKQHFLDDKL